MKPHPATRDTGDSAERCGIGCRSKEKRGARGNQAARHSNLWIEIAFTITSIDTCCQSPAVTHE